MTTDEFNLAHKELRAYHPCLQKFHLMAERLPEHRQTEAYQRIAHAADVFDAELEALIAEGMKLVRVH